MDPLEKLEEAALRAKTLSKKPDNETLLALYGLYKQATQGDVSGDPPGMFDFVGRAKHEAWASRRGLARQAAVDAYIALVEKLASG